MEFHLVIILVIQFLLSDDGSIVAIGAPNNDLNG